MSRQVKDLKQDENRRLRVLRIAHASLTPALRGRERGISKRYPDIELKVITPFKWNETGVDIETVGDDYFPVVTAKTFLSKHIQLFLYDPFPVIRELRSFNPDIIDMDHEPYSLPCAEIITLRNRFAPSAKIVMQTAQNIYKNYPQPFRALEKRALRQVSAAYMCSETVREVLEGKGFTGPSVVAPFGIDPDLFGLKKTKENSNEEPAVIGFVGRMIEGKGLLNLVEALTKLKQKDWKLLAVGDGSELEPAKDLLKVHRLLDKATFTGAVNYEDTPALFQQMDMLIVPTVTTPTIREQFGRVIIEAMACGVPVIGSTCGAIPEVIGDSGVVFEEGNAGDLAAKIDSLIGNPALRDSLAEKGLERVNNNFTWAHAAERIVSAYEAALQTGEERDANSAGRMTDFPFNNERFEEV